MLQTPKDEKVSKETFESADFKRAASEGMGQNRNWVSVSFCFMLFLSCLHSLISAECSFLTTSSPFFPDTYKPGNEGNTPRWVSDQNCSSCLYKQGERCVYKGCAIRPVWASASSSLKNQRFRLKLGLLLLTGACTVWQSGEHFPSFLPPEFLPWS